MPAAVVRVDAKPGVSTGTRAPVKMFVMVAALDAPQAPTRRPWSSGVRVPSCLWAMSTSWVLGEPAGAWYTLADLVD